MKTYYQVKWYINKDQKPNNYYFEKQEVIADYFKNAFPSTDAAIAAAKGYTPSRIEIIEIRAQKQQQATVLQDEVVTEAGERIYVIS